MDNQDKQYDRPYFSHKIDLLEALAALHWSDGNHVTLLIVELFHRKTQRAVALRNQLIQRLSELITDGFAWPSTNAEPTEGEPLALIDAPDIGLLSFLGYRVGNCGLELKERRELLATVFSDRLPPLNSMEYMGEWGDPATATRLRKLANSIAAFARNAKHKRNPPEQAISDWEGDLGYLYAKYYLGQFDFFWPNPSMS